jgi:uncharacterized lipoprotein YajG
MRLIYFLVILFLLAGCSTPKVAGFKGPETLSRNEVIQSARECVSAKLKPVVQYVSQKTEFGTILVPVDVYCDIYR